MDVGTGIGDDAAVFQSGTDAALQLAGLLIKEGRGPVSYTHLLQDVLAALADIRVPIYAVNARQVENNCAMVSLTIGINNTCLLYTSRCV